ncbi:hypothetical protein Q8F55_005971 [Vanrija albida]|uniref:WSC domain-containing protein n=1 Tax=Vanrija albida TaxID=181172 RepID=A0ABR3Q3N3_9TREE
MMPRYTSFVTAVANDGASCAAAGGSMSYMLGSKFAFQECWSFIKRDPRDIDAGGWKDGVNTFDSCAAICADWEWFYEQFAGSARSCYCANYFPVDVQRPTQNCPPNYFYAYRQVRAEPSGAPGRRRRARAELERQKLLASSPDCPAGVQACSVFPGADGYECLDTQSELESCGGCRFGVHGAANTTATGVE